MRSPLTFAAPEADAAPLAAGLALAAADPAGDVLAAGFALAAADAAGDALPAGLGAALDAAGAAEDGAGEAGAEFPPQAVTRSMSPQEMGVIQRIRSIPPEKFRSW
ncbi:MAG: hypothetical protein JO247_22100 [Chloroflexi bacterium]|nr:hypothetical protein [Chloroflexota bacterium]